jgi:hypothetical protein
MKMIPSVIVMNLSHINHCNHIDHDATVLRHYDLLEEEKLSN